MFKYLTFIRKNTPELRKKLDELGYKPSFIDGDCIHCDTKDYCAFNHGNMELNDKNSEMIVNKLLEGYPGTIDCDTDERLFLAVTAMRDDNDYMQWFVSQNWRDGNGNPLPDKWVLCTCNTLAEFGMMNNSPNSYSKNGFGWHKATLEELQEHFKIKTK